MTDIFTIEKEYPKGSELRKWDLHIHTPASFNFSTLGSPVNITAEFTASAPGSFVPYNDGGVSVDNIFPGGYWHFSSSATPANTYSVSRSRGSVRSKRSSCCARGRKTDARRSSSEPRVPRLLPRSRQRRGTWTCHAAGKPGCCS